MRFDFYTPSEISKSLGKRLKQQRLYQNLTQVELAQKAGIGLSTVSRIESGEGGTLDNVIRYGDCKNFCVNRNKRQKFTQGKIHERGQHRIRII